jgi:hypothetical protein
MRNGANRAVNANWDVNGAGDDVIGQIHVSG